MLTVKPAFLNVDIIIVFSAVLLTILSQHPLVLDSGTGRLLLYVWVVPIVRLFIVRKIVLDTIILIPLLLYFFLYLFLLFAEIYSGNQYLDLPNRVNMQQLLLMMATGYYLGAQMTEEEFSRALFWSCLLGGLLFCIGIYSYSSIATYNIQTRTYVYLQKNSASQIIFSCFMFVLLLPKHSLSSWIRYPALCFMLYLIFVMKSRATILAILLLVPVFVMKSGNRMLQACTILIVASGIIAVSALPQLQTIVVDGILFGGRDATNYDDVSSGRFSMTAAFPKLFQEDLLIGKGYYYMESFPLATLLQLGIIGSPIIFGFLYWVVRSMRTYFSTVRPLDLSLMILWYTLLFNALFEEQAPLGPGAKTFLFWFPFGFVLAKRTQPPVSYEYPLTHGAQHVSYCHHESSVVL